MYEYTYTYHIRVYGLMTIQKCKHTPPTQKKFSSAIKSCLHNNASCIALLHVRKLVLTTQHTMTPTNSISPSQSAAKFSSYLLCNK